MADLDPTAIMAEQERLDSIREADRALGAEVPVDFPLATHDRRYLLGEVDRLAAALAEAQEREQRVRAACVDFYNDKTGALTFWAKVDDALGQPRAREVS